MLKIAVCDDSPLFLELAIKFINKWSEERQFPVSISSYNNGDDLLAANAEERMDIIFLDIIMPLLNGMDTARELRQTDKAVKIIFLTSSPEFALESYEVKAQGYVLKPIVYEQLKDTLDECAHTITDEPAHIVLKTSFGYQKLYLHDIEYAEAQNKKVVFHLCTGDTLEASEPLHSFESRFTEDNRFSKLSGISAECRSFHHHTDYNEVRQVHPDCPWLCKSFQRSIFCTNVPGLRGIHYAYKYFKSDP